MSIRLSKACKDLNVGMSTAIDFLAKKGHKLLVDPNLKLTDEEHLLLAKEFNKDMALKMESERLSTERHLKEKAASVVLDGYAKPVQETKPVEAIKTIVPEDSKPHIKAVGQIDLDALNKPHTKQVEKPQPQKEDVKVYHQEKPVEKPIEKPIEIPTEKPITTLRESLPSSAARSRSASSGLSAKTRCWSGNSRWKREKLITFPLTKRTRHAGGRLTLALAPTPPQRPVIMSSKAEFSRISSIRLLPLP
jgi:translation initiation factor IF-2